MIKFFILLIGFTVSTSGFAYIPSSKMIFNRLTANSGKGIYQIDQELQIQLDKESLTLKERWWIDGGDILRVSMSSAKGGSDGFHFDALYRGQKKIFLESPGQVKTAALPSDFTEQIGFIRSPQNLVDFLILNKILPANLDKDRKSVTPNKRQSENFVRLARTGGVVTWAFGEPSPPTSDKNLPAFFVEQDSFLWRRIRLMSQAEISVDQYMSGPLGLRIPKEKTISWDNNTIVIRTLGVHSIAGSSAAQIFNTSVISNQKNANKLPEHPTIREFYSRFR